MNWNLISFLFTVRLLKIRLGLISFLFVTVVIILESHKISTWTSFVKILKVCSCELNSNLQTCFLIEKPLELYKRIIWRLLFEIKPKSIKAGNLNSYLSCLITTVPPKASENQVASSITGRIRAYLIYRALLLCVRYLAVQWWHRLRMHDI